MAEEEVVPPLLKRIPAAEGRPRIITHHDPDADVAGPDGPLKIGLEADT